MRNATECVKAIYNPAASIYMFLFLLEYSAFKYLRALYWLWTHECLIGHYSTHCTLHNWHSRHHKGSTPQTSWSMCVCGPMHPKCALISFHPLCHLWRQVCTQEEHHICIATRPPTHDQSPTYIKTMSLGLHYSLTCYKSVVSGYRPRLIQADL